MNIILGVLYGIILPKTQRRHDKKTEKYLLRRTLKGSIFSFFSFQIHTTSSNNKLGQKFDIAGCVRESRYNEKGNH